MTNVNNNNTEKVNNHVDGSDNNLDTNMLPTPGCFKNVSDRVLKAKAKLLESPYDLESWNILIKDVQVYLNLWFRLLFNKLLFQGKNSETAHEFYDQLVSYFPTSGRFWKLSIEHEIKMKNYERVEKVKFHF